MKKKSVFTDLTALHFLAGEEEGDRGWDSGFGSFCRILHFTQIIFLWSIRKFKQKPERNRQEQTPKFKVKLRQWLVEGGNKMQKKYRKHKTKENQIKYTLDG